MEVKRICQWCGKPFIAKKTTTCYCSPQCSKRGYKHRMMERKMELRHMQEMLELRSSLEKQEYFTFSQAARLMGVSRQYIYKLVKEEKLRASRLSGKMSLIRRADIELMLKSKPYERMVPKEDFKITEYYTAEEIAQKENGIILGQFVNPANPDIHYRTTGPEIYADMDGDIDFFVAGVGTGGTITGVGKYLKEKIAGIRIIAVEPEKSTVLSSGKSGAHGIQGLGAGFVPPVLDTSVYDEVITVSDADAFSFGRDIAKTEGYLVGISSGAALKAAVEIASRPENAGKKIVTLFPDSGDRYLSTPLFSAENNR